MCFNVSNVMRKSWFLFSARFSDESHIYLSAFINQETTRWVNRCSLRFPVVSTGLCYSTHSKRHAWFASREFWRPSHYSWNSLAPLTHQISYHLTPIFGEWSRKPLYENSHRLLFIKFDNINGLQYNIVKFVSGIQQSIFKCAS